MIKKIYNSIHFGATIAELEDGRLLRLSIMTHSIHVPKLRDELKDVKPAGVPVEERDFLRDQVFHEIEDIIRKGDGYILVIFDAKKDKYILPITPEELRAFLCLP